MAAILQTKFSRGFSLKLKCLNFESCFTGVCFNRQKSPLVQVMTWRRQAPTHWEDHFRLTFCCRAQWVSMLTIIWQDFTMYWNSLSQHTSQYVSKLKKIKIKIEGNIWCVPLVELDRLYTTNPVDCGWFIIQQIEAWTKWRPFCRQHFHNYAYFWKKKVRILNFTEVCSHG